MPNIYSNGLRLNSPHSIEAISETDLYQIILAQKGVEKKQPAPPKKLGLAYSLKNHVKNLKMVRWGIIWYPNDSKVTPAEKLHRQYLQKLIDLRQTQMGYNLPQLLFESGWTAPDFLQQNGVSTGDMQTAAVPYYLLIVASPERIPWDFQQQLDGEYAVGRLWFDDPLDCQRYVEHLLAYEAGAPAKARETLVVGTRHNGDPITQSSAPELVQPLYDWLKADPDGRGYQASLLLGDEWEQEALRYKVLDRLKGTAQPAPALLFTATHGLNEPDDPATCGALVMQDWPGEPHPLKLSYCLAGEAALASLPLEGMLAFCFACYSAGVPHLQDWVHPATGKAKVLAPVPYVSRLPQKLLAQGLLGFIGHVSKAWDFSYLGATLASPHIGSFKETLAQLMDGLPVGHALDALNLRTLSLSGVVADMLEHPEKYQDEQQVINTWMARNDCRGHVLLGDPFAAIRV